MTTVAEEDYTSLEVDAVATLAVSSSAPVFIDDEDYTSLEVDAVATLAVSSKAPVFVDDEDYTSLEVDAVATLTVCGDDDFTEVEQIRLQQLNHNRIDPNSGC